jgi:hypothetical protein
LPACGVPAFRLAVCGAGKRANANVAHVIIISIFLPQVEPAWVPYDGAGLRLAKVLMFATRGIGGFR